VTKTHSEQLNLCIIRFIVEKSKIKFIFEELQQANVTHSVEWPKY